MTSSEQLERETEQTRAAFERTLDELRARVTPGQVVDQIVQYARGGPAGQFFRNLSQRTLENPLPLVVVGAGLAWLIAANGRDSRSVPAGPSAGTIAGAARSAASHVGDLASQAKTRVMGGDRSEPQLGQTEARESGITQLFRDHPIALIGLGLAVGAAVGAMITPPLRESQEEKDAKDRVGHMGEDVREGYTRYVQNPEDEELVPARQMGTGDDLRGSSEYRNPGDIAEERAGSGNSSDAPPRPMGTAPL